MLWNYSCPDCHRPTSADWRLREAEVVCHLCERTHYPPTPHEDRYAYVDSDKWPKEIEDAVSALRGTICSVPGCYRERATLVHRQSLATGGRTSADNLMPMCERHAASKGDKNYDEWLVAVRQEDADKKRDEPTFEITITSRPPAPDIPAADFSVPSGVMLPLASARAPRSVKAAAPTSQPLAELKIAVPFLRGPAGKVVFDYDWEMKKSGRCHVFLLAWPRGDEPDISPLGGPKYAGISMAKDHLGVSNEKGSAQLELLLPGLPGGRWVAAVALLDEGCELQFTEYALAATT
jgi:hypothetical protein